MRLRLNVVLAVLVPIFVLWQSRLRTAAPDPLAVGSFWHSAEADVLSDNKKACPGVHVRESVNKSVEATDWCPALAVGVIKVSGTLHPRCSGDRHFYEIVHDAGAPKMVGVAAGAKYRAMERASLVADGKQIDAGDERPASAQRSPSARHIMSRVHIAPFHNMGL
jgi:hypothetical protein